EAAAELRKFVEGEKERLAWRGVQGECGFMLTLCGADEFKAMDYGLELIAGLIEGRRHTASTVNLWLGSTRNTGKKEARENVAIWQIAWGMLRATGNPHTREVAEIAGVILGVTVTEDRVRAIVRKRQK